jgi:hypothetical protein
MCGRTLNLRPDLCFHNCHTIKLHGINTLGITPSSLDNILTQTPSYAATEALIYSNFVVESIMMFTFETLLLA